MILVKKEMLAAFAGTLESFSPGAGARAVFESPKVAAHGDFAGFVHPLVPMVAAGSELAAQVIEVARLAFAQHHRRLPIARRAHPVTVEEEVGWKAPPGSRRGDVTARLVERLGATVVGCAFLVELGFLDGRRRLEGFDVHALVTYEGD